MTHGFIDAARGFRARLDDRSLVQEVLEELPVELGLSPAMPPFLLPYYNGVDPDDCGISAFLFLAGGHLTLHTFSFREEYFVDVLSPLPFDMDTLASRFEKAFPTRERSHGIHRRGEAVRDAAPIDRTADFGPHLFLDVRGYRGPETLDDLFRVLDTLPNRVGMTPIMRPYVLENQSSARGPVRSGITMIAESHVSVHVFPERREAFVDLFSCRFFDTEVVRPILAALFPGDDAFLHVSSRGRGFRACQPTRRSETVSKRAWVGMVGAAGPSETAKTP